MALSGTIPPFPVRLTPDEVVRQLRHLPSAPRVLPRLKILLSDGNSSIFDIVALIRLDPGIAARVLQIGNSAYYSHGSRCYTVEEAVNRVGFDQVYELVANAVASQVLVRPLTVYGIESDELWKMSVACALAAEKLAIHIKLDQDIAYTIGLLHGLGLVAIDEWAFRQQPELRLVSKGFPLETCEVERSLLGFHNGEAGAALLRLWEFPPVMAEPIRWQYAPRGTAAHVQLAAVLNTAKWVRTMVCSDTSECPLPDSFVLRTLNLETKSLENVAEAVRGELLSLSSLLDTAPVERSSLSFPNGERVIDGIKVQRTFVNGYA